MDLGSIEREIYVDATPEVVFEVVSSPEHITGWWPDEARYVARPGSSGEIVFGDPAAGGGATGFSVLEVYPPTTFSFRWTQAVDEEATEGNSLLVTFSLTPAGEGTLLRMVETGFRERGWEQAVLEQQYREHVAGWDHFLPRLPDYAATLGARA
ncbi:SRPBCC domain-containing protein [Nocardioides sp. YIM 152588]|uniref:SRPBCC domain-containing protein n=1 Tax=Nocardioides sp. YIM 152588 TaxID=3158259 RepID=UPI0032E44572